MAVRFEKGMPSKVVGDMRERLAAGPEATGELAERFHLTPRELEVALLLSAGASNAAIANLLGISEHTARHHTRHVLVKMGLHSRARVAAVVSRELGGASLLLP
jgi:DNA-binding CsgD family transcriptional regulator